jgi:hypothetical protein
MPITEVEVDSITHPLRLSKLQNAKERTKKTKALLTIGVL